MFQIINLNIYPQSLIHIYLLIMFFEFEDIRKRRMPSWGLHNTTGWHTAVDSTPSWNYQRGIMIGFVTHSLQQYIGSFIDHCKLMSKYYEPPTNMREAWTWFKSTTNLQSFKKNAVNRRQIALYGAFFDMGLKLAVFRQFNSGWQANFGGFEYSYYRKIPTFFAAFLVTSPFAVIGQMAQRAFVADSTFPKELQKGYTSYFNALRRIPFEEGPYYLLKNTFPLFMKHTLGPFTAFYSYDFLKDKLSVLWRTGSSPMFPVQLFLAGLCSYMGVVFAYPFAHGTRLMVDFWPKKDGVDLFKGNYRKAAAFLWLSHSSWNISWAGLFKSGYFWKNFPLYFTSLLLADKFGMFSYWRIDIMAGPSDNTPDDSFI